jgi:hypothetical protein
MILWFYYDARIPRSSAEGMNGRRKGIGGAESSRKIPTLIPRRLPTSLELWRSRRWVWVHFLVNSVNLIQRISGLPLFCAC